VNLKVDLLNRAPLPRSEINRQRSSLLINLSKEYPLAFHSFGAEKGAIEQIVDVAELEQEKQAKTDADGLSVLVYKVRCSKFFCEIIMTIAGQRPAKKQLSEQELGEHVLLNR
jgi:hypothetical protein